MRHGDEPIATLVELAHTHHSVQPPEVLWRRGDTLVGMLRVLVQDIPSDLVHVRRAVEVGLEIQVKTAEAPTTIIPTSPRMHPV